MKTTTPKNIWQLQEAKNQLSRVVDRALTAGAQTITRHGRPVVVVLSEADYTALLPIREKRSFGEWLMSCPKIEPDGLQIERTREPVRSISLE